MFKKIIAISFLLGALVYIDSAGKEKPGKEKPLPAPAPNTMCVNASITLDTIRINEILSNDFDIVNGSQETLVLTVVNGSFIFTGNEGMRIGNKADIVGSITNVSSTQITITLTEGGSPSNQSEFNSLNIGGIQFTSNTPGLGSIKISSVGTLEIISFPDDTEVASVIINAPATATIAGNLAVCEDASGEDYITETGMSDYVWTITGNVGISGGGALTDHYIYVDWGTSPGSVAVSYTDTNGCNASSIQPVIVNSGPTISGDQTVCRNAEVTYTAQPGTGYLWHFNGAGAVSDGGDGQDHITLPWNAVESLSIYVEYTTVDGCTGSSETLTISYDDPSSINGSGASCSGAEVNFDIGDHYSNNSGAGSPSFEWVAADNTNVTGESLSSTPGSIITDNLTSSSLVAETITYTVTATSSNLGCTTTFTIDIVVNPIPIGAANATAACSNGALSFALQTTITNGVTADSFEFTADENPNVLGEPKSGSSGYNITGPLTNTTAVSENVIFHVTPKTGSAGLCPGVPYVVTVTVNPTPTLTGQTSVCTGATRFYIAELGNSDYNSWTFEGGTKISGGEDGNDSIQVNWPSAIPGSVSVNYTNIHGCSGTASLSVSIAGSVPSGANDEITICSNEILGINLQTIVNPVSSTFSWIAASNPGIAGESTAAQSTNVIDDVLINTTNPGVAQAVFFTVTPTGACGQGSPFTITVNVNPKPIGTDASAILCGGGVVGYDLSPRITNGVSSIFRWRTDFNPDISGATNADPVTGSTITDNLTNNTALPQTIPYNVTIEGPGNCFGDPFTVTINLDPLPSGSASSATACSDQLFTQPLSTTLSNIVVNANGLVQNAGTISAGSNKPMIELNDDTWTNTGIAPTNVEYTVTPLSGNGCLGSAYTITVTVNPMPVLTTVPATICSDTPIGITLSSSGTSIPATSYDIISIVAGGGLTAGGSNSSVTTGLTSSAIQNDQWTSSASVAETVSYSISPVSAGLCAGTPTIVVATINPAPNTIITNNAPTISNANTTNIALTSNVAGASFSYIFAGTPQITGGSSGTGATINQILNNSVTVQQSVTYSITGSANGCSGSAATATVFVNGNPTISTADSVALVALYNATSGATWTTKTNWLSGAADTWYGIGVTSERVTSIALPTNNVTGPLPVAFFNLNQLTSLTLRDNNISGTLPVEISNFGNLQVLDLRENDLTGTIPDNVYSLTGLSNLSLSSNQFTGSISPLIGGLVNLQILRMENLPMTGTIAPEVFNLTTLQNVALSGKINGPIPSAIGAITGLTQLHCDSCAITSLPTQINTLTNLNTLGLYNNNLTTLPDISALPLTYLNVGKNKLTFESLELNAGVTTFLYAPQDSVGTKVKATIQTNTPYVILSSVGGASNQYQWKKNNVNIPGATSANYTITSPVFSDEGLYAVDVTNTVITGLTLSGRPSDLRVSSLKRDSLSLVQLFNATSGNTWTNKTGWLSTNLSTWNGVTISSNRVTAINLSNNNLKGSVPSAITDMLSLTNANLATNNISMLPNLTSMTQLTSFNVSTNKLDFAALEPNASILGKINFTNQADIGTLKKDSIESGLSQEFKAIVGGANNVYQWKRNSQAVSGATNSTYIIEAISRANMGQYICDVTNPNVPGLTIKTAPHTVLAYSNLSGKLMVDATKPATKGKVTLFRITAANGYDIIAEKNIKDDGSYEFEKIILDNYQIRGFADTLTHVRALPTYYKKTIFWEEADTLFVNNTLNNLNIISEFKPGPPSGKGIISGIVEEEDGAGGRGKKVNRVANAGVTARRVENTGRGKEEILTLVAYVFTNQNGEFEITNLPVGEYRLNIQYPGYPMDENSFVTVPIGLALESQVQVEALVDHGKINVRQLIVTGIFTAEGYSAEVYPNPSHSFIQLRFPSSSESRNVKMYNAMGNEILKSDAHEKSVSLDVQTLARGNYFLNIVDQGTLVKSLHVIID